MNALSTKIFERVVEMSTLPGDLVLDPFGGSGTTFAVCEKKGRQWIGTEIDFAQEIIDQHRIKIPERLIERVLCGALNRPFFILRNRTNSLRIGSTPLPLPRFSPLSG